MRIGMLAAVNHVETINRALGPLMIHLHADVMTGKGRAEVNRGRVVDGASTAIPLEILRNRPLRNKAVLSAANPFARAGCSKYSRKVASYSLPRNASRKSIATTPSGNAANDERSRRSIPFTNTTVLSRA